MPSPFPGMDPYLEAPAVWPGVHDKLIVYIAEVLQPLLLPRYYVDVGERIYLEDPREVVYPDASIRERARVDDASGGGVATLTADEPAIPLLDERQRETFLEIRAAGSQDVVTIIEVLSPANKRSGARGRDEYRDKQDQVLASDTNLVEIDLLRQGLSVAVAPPGRLLALPRFDYLACVSRAGDRRRVEVHSFSIRERLPRIKVPLRHPDPDVVLDLAAAFTRCYDVGAYAVRIDYSQPPADPLRADDEAWADALLRNAGVRGDAGDPQGPAA